MRYLACSLCSNFSSRGSLPVLIISGNGLGSSRSLWGRAPRSSANLEIDRGNQYISRELDYFRSCECLNCGFCLPFCGLILTSLRATNHCLLQSASKLWPLRFGKAHCNDLRNAVKEQFICKNVWSEVLQIQSKRSCWGWKHECAFYSSTRLKLKALIGAETNNWWLIAQTPRYLGIKRVAHLPMILRMQIHVKKAKDNWDSNPRNPLFLTRVYDPNIH